MTAVTSHQAHFKHTAADEQLRNVSQSPGTFHSPRTPNVPDAIPASARRSSISESQRLRSQRMSIVRQGSSRIFEKTRKPPPGFCPGCGRAALLRNRLLCRFESPLPHGRFGFLRGRHLGLLCSRPIFDGAPQPSRAALPAHRLRNFVTRSRPFHAENFFVTFNDDFSTKISLN